MFKTQITRLLVLVVIVDICAMIGCHRGYYRRQADAEASRLVEQKATNPRWDTPDGEIEIDPMSRMFDPFSADHPPIPPDDPTSHQLMHCVDDKPGYPLWHANGDTDYVSNPEWLSYLPVNEKGQLVLNLDRAFQLALLHSPDWQQQKETLYLSALDVSLERFGFDSQLFAGTNKFYSYSGRFRGSDPLRPVNVTGGSIPDAATIDSGRSSSQLESSLGANGGGITLEKLGITGTNFVVSLANTILWDLTGPGKGYSVGSIIDFSIVQPLLRNAGRDRIMESLTQSERNLLANVRQLERFRRGFYLEVATGRAPGSGPSRGGALAFLAVPASATTNIGGYFGLLFQQQQIRNQELNVRQLEAVLELFREFFLRERLDAVQLKLFESTVYNQQSSLLESKINYQTAVDRFVRSLGLPPHLDVVIEDEFLDRFEFISDEINERLIGIGDLRESTGSALNLIDDMLPDSMTDVENVGFGWSDALNQRIEDLAPYLEQAIATLQAIEQDDLPQVAEDFERLDAVREDRVAYLKKLRQAIQSGQIISDVDPLLYEPDSIPTTEDLKRSLDDPDNPRNIVNRMSRLAENLEQSLSVVQGIEQEQSGLTPQQLFQVILEQLQETIPGQLSELNNILLEVSLLQARARSNSVEINDVEINAEMATRVARCLRRDWMNARAALVDQWRQIEFVADQLESQFDLILEGDIRNVGDNPFKLRYETGQLRGGFRFDAPIVRLAERNQYRATLINYQQTRRRFYQFEDEISRNLRQIVRNLDRDKVLFELNRRSVQVQIEQIELNRFSLEEPVAPNAGSARLGTSTARNLADAINGLNTFQNRYLGTWVEYEILRRSLDFDMGTMQVDEFGRWIDPGLIDETIGVRYANSVGIELDCQFCDFGDFSFDETGGLAGDIAPDYSPAEQIQMEVDREIESEIERENEELDAPRPSTRIETPTPKTIERPSIPNEDSYFRPVPGNREIEPPPRPNGIGPNSTSMIELNQPWVTSEFQRLPSLPVGPATAPIQQVSKVSMASLLEVSETDRIPSHTNGNAQSSTLPPETKADRLRWESEFQSFGNRFDRFSSAKSPKDDQ